ncbi:hypothetical protein UlMin_003673 [Ulmus minor]
MKLIKLLFVSSLLLVLALSIEAMPKIEEKEDGQLSKDYYDNDEALLSSMLNGRRHFQSQKKRKRLTCNKFPVICSAKGSPGPHCCKKKCVNVLTDRHNCGLCGKKCKYNEICCKGKCVNPSFNRRHCGGCNVRCQVGGFCAFGLCNYA